MRHFLIIACCAIVLGCSSTSDKLVQPAQPTIDQLETSVSNGETEIKADWWTAVGDDQLSTLVEKALLQSPTLEAAAMRIAAAQAIANAQQANLIPQVGLNAQVDKQQLSQNYFFAPGMDTYNGYGLIQGTFNWSLDIWGKQRKYFEAAQRRANAAQLNLEAAKLLLTTTLVKVYIDFDRAAQLQILNEREASIRDSLYQITAARQNAGLADALEVNQRLADRDLARARLTQTKSSVVVVQHQLAALVGQGPSWGEQLKMPSLNWKEQDLPANIPANLLARRPDLLVLREQVEASGLDLAGAKLEYLPDVNLQAYGGVQAIGLPLLFSSSSQMFSVGPVLSLPIFDAGRIEANILGKEANRNEKIATYQDQLLNALKEAADGISTVKNTLSEVLQNQQSLARADNNLLIQQKRKQAGLTTADNVMNSQLFSLQLERAVLETKNRLDIAKVSLIQALGGAYQSNTKNQHQKP